jgi:hypothetical protein
MFYNIDTRASKKSTAISSEVSSAAEDRSDKSHYVVINDVVPIPPRTSRIASPVTVDSKPSSRIEMYQTDWVEVPEPAPVQVPRIKMKLFSSSFKLLAHKLVRLSQANLSSLVYFASKARSLPCRSFSRVSSGLTRNFIFALA